MKTIKVKCNTIAYGISKGILEIEEQIIKSLESQKFIDYLSDVLYEQIIEIAKERIMTIDDKDLDSMGVEKKDYLLGFGHNTNGNTIILFNNSIVRLDEKVLKPSTRERYTSELSLAHIIEFGIGYTGGTGVAASKTSLFDDNDWQFDVRNHGYKGWYYKDKSGGIHWTNGLEGRQVFIGLIEWLEENISNIIADYLKNNL